MGLPENQNDVANINLINSGISTSTDILTDRIYDVHPDAEGLSEKVNKEVDTPTKKRLQSTISSSAVTAADLYSEQMQALTSDPTYKVTPFQDSTTPSVIGADSTYFSTGNNLKSQQSYASQFDNVNGDNIDSYYTTVKKTDVSMDNIFTSIGKSTEGFQ